MKPYVICHMNASVDGRILGSRWRPAENRMAGLFERLHEQLGGGSWLIGRVTGSEYAKAEAYPDHTDQTYPREPWFARRDAAAYGIADASKSGRLDRELGLFLDELANIVPVEDLPALASQGAGRGVVLMSIVQDLSQLRARYGADRAHSILNNHTCKVVLPGVGDPETADVLSRLVGQRHFTDVQVNRGADGRVSRSYASRLEPLATPDALRQLHEGTAVVLYRGRPAAVIRTRPWFENRTMRRLSQRSYVRNAEEVRRAA